MTWISNVVIYLLKVNLQPFSGVELSWDLFL